MADFQWDPVKQEKNINDHLIDFTTASQIWEALSSKGSMVVAITGRLGSSPPVKSKVV